MKIKYYKLNERVKEDETLYDAIELFEDSTIFTNKNYGYLKKQNEHDTSLEEGNFQEFVKYYNGIESMIIRQSIKLTNSITNEASIKNTKFYPPNILDALKILISAEIINKELAHSISKLTSVA